MKTRIYAKAIVLRKGQALVIRRSVTHPTKAGRWDIPGGILADGETPQAAVAREVKEETGLPIIIRGIQSIHVHREPEHRDWRKIFRIKRLCIGLVFVAESPAMQDVTLSTEHDEARWVDGDDVVEIGNIAAKYRTDLLNVLH